ncbi:MAG: hypothetical protein V1767_00725 [Chloroflexota bacterium]
MPRIYDEFDNPYDFCKSCFPDERDFQDGKNNSYDADHPPYEWEDYRCETCGKILDCGDD